MNRKNTAISLALLIGLVLTATPNAAEAEQFWQLTIQYDNQSIRILEAGLIPSMAKKVVTPGLKAAPLRISYEADWLSASGQILRSTELEIPIGVRSTFDENGPCVESVPESDVVVIRIPGPTEGSTPATLELNRVGVTGRSVYKLQAPAVFDQSRVSLEIESIYSSGSLREGPLSIEKIQDTGPDGNRLVIVVMGDGYTLDVLNTGKFTNDAMVFVNSFGQEVPWNLFFQATNVYRIDAESNETGADHEVYGVYKDTYFHSSFWTNNIERLLAINSTGQFRAYEAANDMVGYGMWDYLLVLVNSTKYGGSGGNVAVASMHSAAPDVILHELGHSFGHLANEYESAYPGYPPGDSEPNVDFDFSGPGLKWSVWVEPGTTLPTPENSSYGNVVGSFEGARYQSTGIYRPWYNCLMRSLGVAFCPICREAHSLEFLGSVSLEDDIYPSEQGLYGVGESAVQFGITPIPIPNLTYEWSIGGEVLVGETGPDLYLTNSGQLPGLQSLALRVAFESDLVRKDAIFTDYGWNLMIETGGCCIGLTGNVDYDQFDVIDGGDLTKLIDYLFISFDPIVCPAEANIDADPDGLIDVGDLTALISYLYISFTPPEPCE